MKRDFFDYDAASDVVRATRVVNSIGDLVLPEALDVAKTRASSQDTSLGNIRTRAGQVLAIAALMVTFATSVGLLSNNATTGGKQLGHDAALTLFVILLLIALLTSLVQLPLVWTFDSGTDVFQKLDTAEAGQRAALMKLETGIVRNQKQLHRLLQAYSLSLCLLAAEAGVIVVDLAVR